MGTQKTKYKTSRKLILWRLFVATVIAILVIFIVAVITGLVFLDIRYSGVSFNIASINIQTIVFGISDILIPFVNDKLFKNKDMKLYGIDYKEFVKIKGSNAVGFGRTLTISIVLFVAIFVFASLGFELINAFLRGCVIALFFYCFFNDYQLLHKNQKKINKTIENIIKAAPYQTFSYIASQAPKDNTIRLIRNFILTPDSNTNNVMMVYEDLAKKHYRKKDLIPSLINMQISYFVDCYKHLYNINRLGDGIDYDDISLTKAIDASISNSIYLIDKKPDMIRENNDRDCSYLLSKLICVVHKIIDNLQLNNAYEYSFNDLMERLLTMSSDSTYEPNITKAEILSYIECITLGNDSLWFIDYLSKYIITSNKKGICTNYLLVHCSIYLDLWYKDSGGVSPSCLTFNTSFLPIWKQYLKATLIGKDTFWISNFLIFDLSFYSNIIKRNFISKIVSNPAFTLPCSEKNIASWWIDYLVSVSNDLSIYSFNKIPVQPYYKKIITDVVNERKTNGTLNLVLSDYFAFYDLPITGDNMSIDNLIDDFLKSIS